MTTTYHVSNLGCLAGNVRPDIDGYVHLTAAAVLAGWWDAADDIDAAQAAAIAAHNRGATARAERRIAEWQVS